jgi:5-methylcytosine-specific restriction protein A
MAGRMTTRRPIGQRERLAIFARAECRCHICGEVIKAVSERWDVEHVIPLEMGGDEAKGSKNLQPAHAACHKTKTSVDAWQIAKSKRREARHLGAVKPRSPLSHPNLKKKLDGTVVRRNDP